MEQRKQRILEKLAEVRETRVSAMKHFAQAQARMLQVEARLRSVRERLKDSQALSNASGGQVAQQDGNADSSTHEGSAAAIVTPPFAPGEPITAQATAEICEEAAPAECAPKTIPDENMVERDASVDQKEPEKSPSAPTTDSAAQSETQDTDATDITTKIPVIRRGQRSSQEQA